MDASLSSTLTSCMPHVHSFRPKSSSRYKIFPVVSCRNVTDRSRGRNSINFQRVLSTECKNASVDEIKRAYRKMALQYHPDVCDISIKEESTRMFVALQEAYRHLLHEALQKDYYRGTGLERYRRAESWKQWENQLFELNRRSQIRKFQKDGSWGCRMRAKI